MKVLQSLVGKIYNWMYNAVPLSTSFYLLSLQLNIHGGRSLQNRSKRFKEVVSKAPGPGAYNVMPSSGNTLRAGMTNVGQDQKLGRKMEGTWVRL